MSGGFEIYPAAWGQLLSSHPAFPRHRPFTLNRTGAEEGHCGGQKAEARQAGTERRSQTNSICRQHKGERGISQHKEQVWSQPVDSHPWQTQERKWNKGGLYHLWRQGHGEPQRQLELGCETPPFAVMPHRKFSASQFETAPTWTCLTKHLTPWEGTPQDK